MSSKKEKEKRRNNITEYERAHRYWEAAEPSIFLFRKHRMWKKNEPTRRCSNGYTVNLKVQMI